MKLKIGCGHKKFKNYINVDLNPKLKPDVIWDIRKKSKFKDNQFEEIYCNNVLEHIDDFAPAMKEFYRILKKGGVLRIYVPHFSDVFWDIPSHKRPFSYYTFHHFIKGHEKTEDTEVYFSKIKTRFMFGKRYAFWNYLVEVFANKFPKLYETTFLRSLFPCWQIEVELIK